MARYPRSRFSDLRFSPIWHSLAYRQIGKRPTKGGRNLLPFNPFRAKVQPCRRSLSASCATLALYGIYSRPERRLNCANANALLRTLFLSVHGRFPTRITSRRRKARSKYPPVTPDALGLVALQMGSCRIAQRRKYPVTRAVGALVVSPALQRGVAET